ncbi:hypothetical protein [Mycobacterium sp.]|uniref:hypothetical protein n=1 Tax=Mycobacterium sp. TaxID=1785 RepID=UPI002607AA76|nr:hypothetical protein [Mycobacterium sp.]
MAHHGRVDEFAVAAYCAEAVGLGAVVVLHDRVRIGDVVVEAGAWSGWIAQLPSKPGRLEWVAERRYPDKSR